MRWSHSISNRYDPETVLTLAAVKAELDVQHNEHDSVLTAHRTAALQWVEKYTGRFCGPVTVNFAADRIPPAGLPLPFAPFISLSTLSVGENAVAAPRSIPGEGGFFLPPAGVLWPSYVAEAGAIRATYLAGYAAGECPEPLIQAAKLMAGVYYDRSPQVEKDTTAIQNLIRHYRYGIG